MKKCLLVLIVLLGITTANAEIKSGACGASLNWTLDTESGALVITGTGSLSLSSTYSYGWKDYASSVKSVVIPEGLTDMPSAAFGTCKNLTTVVWNAVSCAHFEGYSYAPFYNSSGEILKQITSFTFGANVQRIPAYLCEDMSALTEIHIPSTVTVIGQSAFYGCTGLTGVVLPEGLKTMEVSAFSGCTKLASVNIPKSLKVIKNYVFYNTALPSIALHDGITAIGTKAFYKCPFTEVTIPAAVTYMGDETFSGCSKLTKVVWNAVRCDHFSSSNYSPFYDSDNKVARQITSFTFGDTICQIPAYLCYEMSSLEEIKIPSTVTTIGQSAFYHCSNLTEIVLPEGLKTMEVSAFSGCTKLASVNIPKSLKVIKNYVFYGTALPSIDLHDGITDIGKYAFYKCPFTEVTIPARVTYVGESAFGECSKLTKVVWKAVNCSDFSSNNVAPFYDTKTTLGQITSFAFGDTIRRIPAHLCRDMKNLEFVSIPATVNAIGNYAFYNCNALKTIFNYAATPQSINANVFTGVDKKACSLYVPKSAFELYAAKDVWKEFIGAKMDPVYEELYETACDTYKWEGTTYTASQNVVKELKAKSGNDSIVTLHLTINYSNIGEETQSAIGSYEWHGETYTKSGDYQYTLTNAAGCDSVVTLHLTVTPVWAVKIEQPEHGTIACMEDVVLSHVTDKSTLHFEAYPDANYVLDKWIGCAEDGSLVVAKDVTVSCTFKEDKVSSVNVANGQSEDCEKTIRNGNMYILRNGKMYSVTGAAMK